MTLRGLTLHQPWASLIAQRDKRYETRSWRPPQGVTHLAIHAGKHVERSVLKSHAFQSALGASPFLPTGSILCIAKIVDVIETDGLVPFDRRRLGCYEGAFGNFAKGRFAWKLEVVLQCVPPIVHRGAQRLWKLEPAIERALTVELEGRAA